MAGDTASELVINHVLCYVSTARHALKYDDIVRVCLTFFNIEDIIRAKDLVYASAGKKSKRRRGDDRALNEIEDLLDILRICEDSGIILPKYVTDSYNSLPPTSGFEVVAHSMVALIDEISSLKREVEFLKEKRLADTVYHHDATIMKEDLLTIKGELRKLNHGLMHNEVRRNSLLVQSLDTPYQNTKESNRRQEDIMDLCFNELTSSLNNNVCETDVPISLLGATSTLEEPCDLLPRSFQDEGGHPSAPPYAGVVKGTSRYSTCSEDGMRTTSFSPNAPPLSQRSNVTVDKEGTAPKVTLTTDAEGFQLVNKKKNKKQPTIVGLRKTTGNSGIKGAKKTADLYVGNCDVSVTADSLNKYILDDLGIQVDKCDALVTKSTGCRSFKITLNLGDRQKLLSSEVWPEGILCRKFFNPRKKIEHNA